MDTFFRRTGIEFGEPLGLLADCHRRMENFLVRMLAVVEAQTEGSTSQRGLTYTDCQTLAVALRYFRDVAPLHTRDEEESLFPRLRRRNGSRGGQLLLDALAALEADHTAMGALHTRVDRLCRRWMHAGALSEVDLARLWDDLNRLRETCGRHIAVEDARLFPLAAGTLPAAELREIGREMAYRRGIDLDRLPNERFVLRHAAAIQDKRGSYATPLSSTAIPARVQA